MATRLFASEDNHGRPARGPRLHGALRRVVDLVDEALPQLGFAAPVDHVSASVVASDPAAFGRALSSERSA